MHVTKDYKLSLEGQLGSKNNSKPNSIRFSQNEKVKMLTI